MANLHEQIPSVLTHGGKIEDGFASTLATAHTHNSKQAEVVHPSAPATEYPKHVHKHPDGDIPADYKVVNNAEEHQVALEAGWSDYPAEITREEKGKSVVAPAPPALGSGSPHPRHMHYDDPINEQEGEE